MSTPSATNKPPEAEAAEERRIHLVQVRLTDSELADVETQQADLRSSEGRSVSRAEIIRRRAWGLLPFYRASA